MQLQVLEKEECEAMGMGLFLGVSQGSDESPKLIHLTYKAKDSQPGGKVRCRKELVSGSVRDGRAYG
jgi:leucyl aminopeptidase